MPAPLAKGIIIAASVLVAAGIAIYESPQVRQWVDQGRRKIAVALHSLGDEVQPRRPSESSDDFEHRKRDTARRRRNELIRRAREEGVAVDLDELARIGQEEERRERRRTNASQRSFDDLVGSDGMLKRETESAETATATENTHDNAGMRNRGVASFAAGAAAAAGGNPFDDDVLFDRYDDDAPAASANPFMNPEPRTRESSTATMETDEHVPSATAGQLIDLAPESIHLHPSAVQTAPTSAFASASASATDVDQAAQSFYSFTSERSSDDEIEIENISAGTLTPRSEASDLVASASVAGSQASDVGIMSLSMGMSTENENDTNTHADFDDARSEIFSESGFTEAGFSEAGFSELGEENRGIVTPSSWSNVGSDDESEWGGPAVGGQVSQVY
jgi:hypothetical protein